MAQALTALKWGTYYTTPNNRADVFMARQYQIGRQFDIASWFISFDSVPSGHQEFLDVANFAAPAGSVTTLVAWQPSKTTAFSLSDILAGNYDAHIDSWADFFFTFPAPVVVRWGHEMNGTFMSWNPCFTGSTANSVAIAGVSTGNPTVITTAAAHGLATGQTVYIQGANNITKGAYDVTVVDATTIAIPINTTTNWTSGGTVKWSKTTKNAAQFRQAWQYMVSKVATRASSTGKTNNVKWYFCANQNDAPGDSVPMESFYPGDSYVDIVGYDSYNTLNGKYMTPLETVRGFTNNTQADAYDRVTAIAQNSQPVWIGEMNCVDLNDPKDTSNTALGHSKANWYAELFAMDTASVPRLQAVNMFDWPGTRTTWPYDSSITAFAGFQAAFVTGTYSPAPAPIPITGQPPAWTGYKMPGPEMHTPIMNGDGTVDPAARSLGGEISAIWHYLNQISPTVGGWNTLVANTDGTAPAAIITANQVGTIAQPILQIQPAINSLKSVMAIQMVGDTSPTFQINQDGSLRFGPGGSTVSDVRLTRSGPATLTVDQYLTVGAGLTANAFTGSVQTLVNATNVTRPPAGVGVKAYASNDAFYIATGAKAFPVRPNAMDMNGRYGPFDPATATGSITVSPGSLYLSKVWVNETKTVTKSGVNLLTAGSGLSGCYQGIYDISGTLLGSTADLSTTFTSAGGYLSTLTVASGQSLTLAPNYYFVATLIGAGSTTAPTLSGSAGLANWGGLTGTNSRALKYSSGLTALPDTVNFGSIGPQNSIIYQDVN